MKKTIMGVDHIKIFIVGIAMVTGWAGVVMALIICFYYYRMRHHPAEIEYFPNGKIKKKTYRRVF